MYKRNQHGNVFCREHAWEDVEGGNILPGFILEVWKVEEAISQVRHRYYLYVAYLSPLMFFDHRHHPNHHHQRVKNCKLNALNVTQLSLIVTLSRNIIQMSMLVNGVEQSRALVFFYRIMSSALGLINYFLAQHRMQIEH